MRRIRIPTRLFTAFVMLQSLSCAGAPQHANRSPEAADTVAGMMDDHFRQREADGFSGVLLIAADGKIVLEKAYGTRDPRSGAPMRAGDVFDIGSLVKPITRAAVLKLESEGKLRLADSIAKFFPEVPADKRAITIADVVKHRAGFPDSFGRDDELITAEDLLERLMKSPLIAPVGEEENYSNAGYSLLAMLIERVSGTPYEEYVDEAIFKPAGVKGVGYAIPHWPARTLAVGTRRDGRPSGTALDHAWYGDGPGWHLRGNGGMLANARDIYTLFMAMEQNPNVLPPAAREAWLPAFTDDGERGYGSAGGNGIFNAVVFRDIVNDLTMVGMSNTGDQQIEEEATGAVVEDAVRIWREWRGAPAAPRNGG